MLERQEERLTLPNSLTTPSNKIANDDRIQKTMEVDDANVSMANKGEFPYCDFLQSTCSDCTTFLQIP